MTRSRLALILTVLGIAALFAFAAPDILLWIGWQQ